ncbi:MAG TPA: L,D-transpeptidase [Nocardioides sp.]|nr:L,D-transpeptidase [Nocardioides sp.]
MTRRQHDVRPRYGRIAGLGSSVTITMVAVLGGTGVLPSAADEPSARDAVAVIRQAAAILPPVGSDRHESSRRTPDSSDRRTSAAPDTALPARSGTGRRIVFSEGRQRVWLVGAGDRVERTYLVSGSASDNLDTGSYEVYSRSKLAWGIDDSGTMKYFVRFAHGGNASIGFHDIPVDDGAPVQSVDQLGTPLSHGCIRQRRADAIALWRFAPLGTTVVVTP